jgi:hypothetical protein
MSALKNLENKLKLTITKAKVKETFEQLTRFSIFKDFYRIKGQKITHEDPYGEENWEDGIKQTFTDEEIEE